jgi:hypothetical protein
MHKHTYTLMQETVTHEWHHYYTTRKQAITILFQGYIGT